MHWPFHASAGEVPLLKEPLRQLRDVFWMLNQIANPNTTHINSMFGLTKIRRQFVVYFCLHRGEFAGKHCNEASAKRRILSLPSGVQKRQNFAHMKILPLKHSINRVPCRLGLLIPLALACFAFLPGAQAICNEGCDSSLFNAFLGDDALSSNTMGTGNTAIGWCSLFSNTYSSVNTCVGGGAISH